MESQNNPKILEVVRAVQDANSLMNPNDGLTEARLPLYSVQELQEQMSAEDFKQGLKLAVIWVLKSNKLGVLGQILEMDSTLAQDPELKDAAKQYLEQAAAQGWEENQEVKELFGL
jgi:hypothetical protein